MCMDHGTKTAFQKVLASYIISQGSHVQPPPALRHDSSRLSVGGRVHKISHGASSSELLFYLFIFFYRGKKSDSGSTALKSVLYLSLTS